MQDYIQMKKAKTHNSAARVVEILTYGMAIMILRSSKI
jgi:hypothetical protein